MAGFFPETLHLVTLSLSWPFVSSHADVKSAMPLLTPAVGRQVGVRIHHRYGSIGYFGQFDELGRGQLFVRLVRN